MLLVLLSLPASATAYTPADVLRAQLSGMPATMVGGIAAQVPAASTDEKACLIQLGVPASIVSTMPGAPVPAGTPPPGAETCRTFGLDGNVLGVDADKARVAADARMAADAVRRAAEARKPECFAVPGGTRAQVDEAPARIEAWLAEQLGKGRTDFFTVPFTTVMSYQGSGGGGTVAVVCAWSDD